MLQSHLISRDLARELHAAASEYPVVTIFGPRQSGKTTLARMEFPEKPYRSLEDPDIRRAAELDPRGFLSDVVSGCILDEIQRAPHLLSYLQGIVDLGASPGTFILTGSHQPELHEAVSQSLAGRTAVLTLLPFSLNEMRQFTGQGSNGVAPEWDAFDLIVKGFFPRLQTKRLVPHRFFNGYVATYVERDLRTQINVKDLIRFQNFLILLAGRIGQVVNYSTLSNDVGVTSTTIKNWISVLKASYVAFELPPYFENIGKRVIKSPKIYFTDTGMVAYLLGIRTAELAKRDPLRGGLYENLIIMELLKSRLNRGLRPDLFYYRDSHGNEVDVLIRQGSRLIAVEIKSSQTFNEDFLKGISAFRRAVGDERSAVGFVFYNGDQTFHVNDVRVSNPLRPDGIPELEAIDQ